MTETNWIRHSFRIGIVEYRRTLRALRESPVQFALLCGGVLLMSLMFLGFSILFASAFRSMSGSIALHASIRGTIGLYWLLNTFITGQRVITQRSRIDAEELVLTTVSARTVAGGLIAADVLRMISYIILPMTIVVGFVVYAFSAPLSALLIPVAVSLFVVSSVVVGYMFGFVGALLLSRSRFVARHKTALGTFLVLVFFGGFSVLLYAPVIDLHIDAGLLAWLPVSWYVDLAAVGSPITQSWANVAGVLATTAIILVGGGYAIERITTALWFDAPVDGDEPPPSTTTLANRDALTSALRPLRLPSGLDAPTHRVAQMTFIRAWRNPSKIWFVLMPVLITGGWLVGFGSVPISLIPVIVAVVIPWVAGAMFGLNPLGDEGSVLPTTLTTAVTGRQYVHGITIPGLIVGLPAIVVLSISTGVVSPYPLVEQMGLMALGIALLFASVQLAPAIGMRFPRFSAIDVEQSREVVPPSLTAMVVHSFVTLSLGVVAAASLLVPGGVRTALQLLVGGVAPFLFELVADAGLSIATIPASWLRSLGATISAMPTMWIRIGGFGLPLVIAIAIADWSRRYASSRFDTYAIE